MTGGGERSALIKALRTATGADVADAHAMANVVIEGLESRGYVITRRELAPVETPGTMEVHVRGTEARLAIKGYPCTCPRGCMEHPFGPPRAHDGDRRAESTPLPPDPPSGFLWPDPDARPSY